MTTESRRVVDTNVIVSALLFEESVSGKAVFWVLDHATILQSLESLRELSEVLGRKKFDKYLTREEREAFLTHLTNTAEVLEITESIRICRDRKDDMLLELAIAGSANGIITGDEDLLALNPFRDIPIMTPVHFVHSAGALGS